ncbi:MAG: hypothetical protein WC523_05890 [Patescibacteria group bacterium]|jgi:hypothetical protein
MKKIENLIKLFLKNNGLEPTECVWCPLNKNEIHIRPIDFPKAEKLEKLLQTGKEQGFVIIIVEPDIRTHAIKELVFLKKETDLKKLRGAYPEKFAPDLPGVEMSDGVFQQAYEG